MVETQSPNYDARPKIYGDAAPSASAADLHLTWEKTESDDEATEPSRPQAPAYMRNWNPGVKLKRGLEVQSDADYATKTEGLVARAHLLHRRNLLAQKYIDLRSAFNRRMVHHTRPSSSAGRATIEEPQGVLRNVAYSQAEDRPRTPTLGESANLALTLYGATSAPRFCNFGAEAKARRRKKDEEVVASFLENSPRPRSSRIVTAVPKHAPEGLDP